MNVRLGLMAWTATAALAVIPATALAAVDAFIWFEGVQGDSHDASHKGAFEIKSFSFGAHNPTTIGSASSGAGAGKVKFNEFTIRKVTDRASPNFFQRALTSHQHFPQVKLEMRKAGGDPHEFMAYRFTNVWVTKIDWSGPGDEGPEESITFTYGSLTLQHASQASDQAGGHAVFSAPMNGLPPPGAVHAPPQGNMAPRPR